ASNTASSAQTSILSPGAQLPKVQYCGSMTADRMMANCNRWQVFFGGVSNRRPDALWRCWPVFRRMNKGRADYSLGGDLRKNDQIKEARSPTERSPRPSFDPITPDWLADRGRAQARAAPSRHRLHTCKDPRELGN